MREKPDLPGRFADDRPTQYKADDTTREKVYKDFLSDTFLRNVKQHPEREKAYREAKELLYRFFELFENTPEHDASDTHERGWEPGHAPSRNVLIEEAKHYADCHAAQKRDLNTVMDNYDNWAPEQAVCHQYVTEVVKSVAEHLGATPTLADEEKKAIEALANQERVFFNNFALYLAFTHVMRDK